MMAAFGGMEMRCADYATYGTEELSANALQALEGCAACLLANHGMIATGMTLDRAMWLAVETETIAKQFYYSRMLGKPVVLGEPEIEDTRRAFANYGQKGKHRDRRSASRADKHGAKARGGTEDLVTNSSQGVSTRSGGWSSPRRSSPRRPGCTKLAAAAAIRPALLRPSR